MNQKERLVELLRKDNCCIDYDCNKCLSNIHCYPKTVADLILDDGWMRLPKDIELQKINIKKYETEFEEIAKALFKIDEDFSGGAKVWVRIDVYKKLMRILALSNHLVKVLKILLTREDAEKALRKDEGK